MAGMKVKLGVANRLILHSILPQQGSFLTLKLLREAKEALSFSEEEHKQYGLVIRDDGSVSWKIDADTDKEFEFGDVLVAIIKKALTTMDKNEQLEEKHFQLYEMFIEGA